MWLDYDDKYAVSEEGLVMHKKSGRISKGTRRKEYNVVCTYNDNTVSSETVHRMVARLFLPRIDIPGLVVDHINRDKRDNRACNLRWVSRSENATNTVIKTNTGERFIHRRFVVQIANPNYHKTFDTLEEAIAARDNILADYINPSR